MGAEINLRTTGGAFVAAKRKKTGGTSSADYRHSDKTRKNIPPARLAADGSIPRAEEARYTYSPHLPPVLRFDPDAQPDRLASLVQAAHRRKLSADEVGELKAALSVAEPWLEWAGKAEEAARGYFEVDPVVLHVHERISTQAILSVAKRRDPEPTLFATPELDYAEAVKFYQHDVEWANRLILGDSLQVMSSLSRREALSGKVQMIYVDPPYGIRFGSNFQPEVGKRNVKDGDRDLSREPETVKAYRDTWHLGVHSYLSYLRDRLIASRDLLADSGSIFVQIGDENVHHVRELLDEVFGRQNFQAQISFKSKSPLGKRGLAKVYDYILWYARDAKLMKFRELFRERDVSDDPEWRFRDDPSRPGAIEVLNKEARGKLEALDGVFCRYKLTSSGFTPTCIYDFDLHGVACKPYGGKSWATNREGMARLIAADRLFLLAGNPRFKQYYSDFPVMKYENCWSDQPGAEARSYVVETPRKFVQRCMLMTTDPGDLILDPTCGSGTTAYLAEQWGRRWITIDTSRVALAIARQRLLTAKYDYYRLRDQHKGVAAGFVYKTVPHITLRSIAQNPNLDPLFERHQHALEEALKECNASLPSVSASDRASLSAKLERLSRERGKKSVTEADRRRWNLPPRRFEHHSVPFDVENEWPQDLRAAVARYRSLWKTRQADVDRCIAANAEMLELVDQPECDRHTVRVSGPFTVEGVMPKELSLSEQGLFAGEPESISVDGGADDSACVVADAPPSRGPETENIRSYLSGMVELIRNGGVRFLGNQERNLAGVEALFESGESDVIHAEGAWSDEKVDSSRKCSVGIAFGPQYGPVTAIQLEDVIRVANRRGYDELVVAGFSFAPEAVATIQEAQHRNLRIHAAFVRPDVNPGMRGLLKTTADSQVFTVFGLPQIEVRRVGDEFVCRLVGVDVYDPVANVVRSAGAEKVAAWFLDGDHDGRTFCITQAFFPDRGAWKDLAKALGGAAEQTAFEAFRGTESLPFHAGVHRRIAVKVIDPRGNEVMATSKLEP